jgi:hypothetical protein
MIMQYEAPKNVYNTGFWLARPHPLVIESFRDIHKSLVGENVLRPDERLG